MVEIRTYIADDKERLLQLIREHIPTYFAPEEEADFSDYLDTKIESYFVIEKEGAIAGCGGINFAENKTVGIISWDMIHPTYHGTGMGTTLLQYRLEILQNIPSINRIIVRTSQLAYTFYEKNGFTLLDIQKDYWAKGLDMYYMEFRNNSCYYTEKH